MLLVTAYRRANLTLRRLVPLFGTSKSAADRIIDHVGPSPALKQRQRFRAGTVLVTDGTLAPARDHSTAEQSKNYRYSVDEHQLGVRARSHCPLPWLGRELGLVPIAPQRAYVGDEFSEHVGRQAPDPPVAGDRCTRHVPHHTTMIDDKEFDASPPTVHELARGKTEIGFTPRRRRGTGWTRLGTVADDLLHVRADTADDIAGDPRYGKERYAYRHHLVGPVRLGTDHRVHA